MKLKTVALLLLLGLATCSFMPSRAETVVVEDAADGEKPDVRAFLLVRRKLSNETPEVGKPFTVTVEVFNTGVAPATSIKVSDKESWSSDIFTAEGTQEAEYDSLPSGGSKSFTYTLIGKEATARYDSAPVKLSYIPLKGDDPVTVSSMGLAVRVFTSTELLAQKALKYGSTISFGILRTETDWIRFAVVLGSLIIVYTANGMYTALSKTREASKRRRALRDLGLADLKSD